MSYESQVHNKKYTDIVQKKQYIVTNKIWKQGEISGKSTGILLLEH